MNIERFVSGASCWIPESLVESTWTEHAPFAFWLIDAHCPRLLVELGTHNGFSYFAFNQAVKQLGAGTACFAVDTWHGDQQAGFYGPEVFERVREYHDRSYADFSQLIRSTFDDAVGRFQDDTIDLLHIDGRHSYEDVKHDFETWKPKLSSRAIVLFHDTCVFEEGFGVHRLWSELRTLYPHFEFVHGCGLGVLGVGSEVHSPVSELFSASQDSAVTDEIRRVYGRLGYSLAVQNTMVSFSNMVKDKEVHIRNLEALLTQKDDQARNLEQQLNAAEQQLNTAEQQLNTAEQQLNTAQLESRQLSGRLAVAEGALNRNRDELRQIQGSASWRMVQRYWSWNLRHFPFGSTRRAAFERIAGSAARLLGVRNRNLQRSKTYLASVPIAAGSHAEADVRDIMLNCDSPTAGEACAGVFLVRGWAIATTGMDKVEILIDDQNIAEAGYGLARVDVAADFPTYSSSDRSGFFVELDTTTLPEGPHALTIIAISKKQQRRSLTVPITIDQSVRHREYDYWISTHEPSADQLREMADEARAFAYQPLVSIAMPVYRTPLKLLGAAIESVQKQIYPNWELCIVDDGSKEEELGQLLQDRGGGDSRVKVKQLPSNRGIASATNAAISMATGDFVGFLDHDDELVPDALYWVAKFLQEHQQADVIYSDEDKLDVVGNRCDPFFKPDWSPDLFLSCNYVCHFLVVRRGLLYAIQGLRTGFDGSQDYDLLLRLIEKTTHIHHIPRVLYHWRAAENSTASSPQTKPKAHLAAERAITEYLKRNNTRALVEQGCDVGRWRVRYEILENPKVTIVMPTGGHIELLQPCIESIQRNTHYPNYEILLVDNSKDSHVQELVARFAEAKGWIQYLDYRGKPFNYSTLNNYAVKQTKAPLVLFLNDDTTTVNAHWLTAMVEHGQRQTVGAVGAKLLYPGGSIQHAGVVMGVFENAGHAFKHIPGDSHYYFCFPQLVRNCSAVTAACMLTRKAVFEELGGFDERNLGVAFQDVDYCLRLSEAGYYVVYTPAAVLVHHESVTKLEKVPNPKEVRYMQRRWADVIENDPFYNPNLSRRSEDYSLRIE